jgi:hypothetical protein
MSSPYGNITPGSGVLSDTSIQQQETIHLANAHSRMVNTDNRPGSSNSSGGVYYFKVDKDYNLDLNSDDDIRETDNDTTSANRSQSVSRLRIAYLPYNTASSWPPMKTGRTSITLSASKQVLPSPTQTRTPLYSPQ